MNANQKIHNATLSKWLDLFKDQVASGKSVKAWCADNGYSTYAYYYWKRAAKEAYLDSVSPDIVPIAAPELPSVASDEEAPCNSTTSLCNLRESRNLYNFSNTSPTETDHSRELYNSRNTEDITVCVGGISIKISPDASDDLIARIIGAVRHAYSPVYTWP